ncbi:hypothetical protein HY029_03475 [Candidatus Gottesmanbacteria bacterium]|nr:hypothetical protein [Candidatus Gottesmanbacteria bacterium]
MKRLLPFIVIFFVVLIYTKPFFRPGFFPTHDGEWAIVRLAEMQREIKDLQIPPRWADYLNHGYGYPLFNFTYPFPFYVGTALRFFHIGLTDSIKIIFVASAVLSALFMFLLGRELGGEYAGLLAAIFYSVAPFRLVDLYIRGSIGESLSLAIFPMLFYLSLKFILKPSLMKMSLCSVVLATLILSHNIMALVFFPFWIVFLYVCLISYYEDIKFYTWRYFLPMIALGLGLAAYFFIPALAEKQLVLLSQVKLADVSSNFINISDYLLSPWNYGIKPSYQLGWAHILAGILAIISLILSKDIDKKKFWPLLIFILGSVFILIFYAHPFSAEFWNVPPLSWFDFPWRFLTPLAFFLALSTIFLPIHKVTKFIGGVLAILTVILSINFASPPTFINNPDAYYATNDATTTSMDELMPNWVINKPTNRYGQKIEVEQGKAQLYNLEYKSNSIKFRVISQSPSIVKVNTIYYPGWKFYINDKEITVNYKSPDGLIRFEAPSGNMGVTGLFKETSLRFWSNIISALSFTLIILFFIFSLVKWVRLKFV